MGKFGHGRWTKTVNVIRGGGIERRHVRVDHRDQIRPHAEFMQVSL